MGVREYKGAAPRTALAGLISSSATSFTVAASGGTGYPTGAGGNFVVAIDIGLASEEKILCSARTGDVFTVAAGGRGWDDTAAAAHNNGAGVDHVGTATDFREANTHVNDTTGDPHPQYLLPAEASALAAALVAARAAVGVRVNNSTGQSIPNATLQALLFNSEDYDSDAFHSTVTNTNRLTVPTGKAGLYAIDGFVAWSNNVTGDRNVVIRLNGVTALASIRHNAVQVAQATEMTISTPFRLAVGDYVELLVSQQSGGALDVNGGCAFALSWLGA